jgi:ABC-type nitrate/sulfonate/bicarbonate transport system ATPase subunit
MSDLTRSKIELRGVRQVFGETEALAPTDLTVSAGEFVSVIGPSGCGKSTLFNVVSGILRPTEGEAFIDGVDVTGKPGRVGYMLQKDLLLPWKTALENITLGAGLRGRVDRRTRDAAAQLATQYGLGEFLDHFPHAMSGGMRQRVALMRTLSFAQDVMLLDEPFGALDSQTRFEMQSWLLSVWGEQESTVLFITHDVDEAVFLSDRIVVMSPRPGRIQEVLTVDLPRPRTLEMFTEPEFIRVKRRALDLIYSRTEGAS